MSARAATARRVAVAAWLLLMLSVAAWPLGAYGIGWPYAAAALLPLLLPVPGLLGGSTRALRAAPLALAPALAVAITEIVANPPARALAGLSLGLAFAAFASLIAAIRVSPQR
jgi:uncharacterized membrane protein